MQEPVDLEMTVDNYLKRESGNSSMKMKMMILKPKKIDEVDLAHGAEEEAVKDEPVKGKTKHS